MLIGQWIGLLRQGILKRPLHSTTSHTARPRRAARIGVREIETLEVRLMMTFNPSGIEQETLYDINHVRVNPQGELNYLFTSLNPLVSPDANVNSAITQFNVDPATFLKQWQALVPTSPLAWNQSLYTASIQHDQAMIAADSQSHQLPGEDPFFTRDSNAGYLNASTSSENIFAFSKSPFYTQSAFLIDWGNATPGHRTNIMDPQIQEAGVGIVPSTDPAKSVGPQVVTQDFGARFDYGNPNIVGVVFSDANGNGRYDAGEGLGNVSLSIVGTGGTFTATSMNAGGYQVKVPAGTYAVTASGPGFSGTSLAQVTVGSTNVETDFVSGVSNGFVNFQTPSATTPSLFAIGSDNQVYVQKFDANGNSTSGYTLTQPGGIKSMVVGSDASNHPELFVQGTDNQIYAQKFDGSGNSAGPYFLAAGGQTLAYTVGHDGSNNPELFVIGIDNQVYAHKFDASGNPIGGYFLAAGGAVKSMAVSRDSLNNPQLFVIGTDNQVYTEKFNANGTPQGSYFLTAGGSVSSIQAGHDASNNPELFVMGLDSHVYALRFDQTDHAVGSYLSVDGQVKSFQVGYDGSNNPEVFQIGLDNQLYAVRFNSSGMPQPPAQLTQSGGIKAITVGRYGGGNPEVFAIGLDNQVYSQRFSAAGLSLGPYAPTKPGAVSVIQASLT